MKPAKKAKTAPKSTEKAKASPKKAAAKDDEDSGKILHILHTNYMCSHGGAVVGGRLGTPLAASSLGHRRLGAPLAQPLAMP